MARPSAMEQRLEQTQAVAAAAAAQAADPKASADQMSAASERLFNPRAPRTVPQADAVAVVAVPPAAVPAVAAPAAAEAFDRFALELKGKNRGASARSVERGLREIFPQAGVEINPRAGYLYANRDKLGPSAEAFYGALYGWLAGHPTLGKRGVRVLDTNFAVVQPGGLLARNIVTGRSKIRSLYEQLSPARRRRYILEPFARALARQDQPPVLHVDHHYAPYVLATVSTTVLLVDLLLHLHETGRTALIGKLRGTMGVMDHSDADIVLAHLVLRNGLDRRFLERNAELLKGAALFNDYMRETGSTPEARARVKLLFNVAVAVEAKIAAGRLTYGQALPLMRAAVERFATEVRVEGEEDVETALFERLREQPRPGTFFELFAEGAADYMADVKRLDELLSEAVAGGRLKTAAAADVAPGTIRRVGPVIFVYLKDGDRAVGNSSVVRYLQARHPALLAGAYMVVTTSQKSGSRAFQMRSFFKDGRFLNLKDPDSGFYTRLNKRVYRGAQRYRANGRHLAGGGGKGGFGALTPEEVSKVLGDIAEAARESASAQFP